MKKTVILAFMLWSSLSAQVGLDKIAQSTMNFQLVSVSPRASALGEAVTASLCGPDAAFYNPAAVRVQDGRFGLLAESTRWIADIDYLAASASWNMGYASTIALHVLSVDYGKIRSTSLISPEELPQYPDGYIDNGTMKNIGASSLGITYAHTVSMQFSIGASLRLVSQSLGQNVLANGLVNNSIQKVAADAGVRYLSSGGNYVFAMSIRNFSSNVKRELIYEQMPLLFTMGTAVNLNKLFHFDERNKLTLSIDFQHPNNFGERMNLGVEYAMNQTLFLRSGIQTNRDLMEYSAGAGLNVPLAGHHLSFDYSWTPVDIFNPVHRIAIGWSL